MKLLRRLSLLLTLAWLFAGTTAAAAAAAATPAAPLTGTITWIYDADTLEVIPHGKVRLLGIDAPERDVSDRDRFFTRLGIAPGRLRSTHGAGIAYGINNVKGKTVTLGLGTPARDRYGRLLAYVHLADGRLLNRLLLTEGLVIVYRRFDFELKNDFLAAEAQAQQRGIGLWSR